MLSPQQHQYSRLDSFNGRSCRNCKGLDQLTNRVSIEVLPEQHRRRNECPADFPVSKGYIRHLLQGKPVAVHELVLWKCTRGLHEGSWVMAVCVHASCRKLHQGATTGAVICSGQLHAPAMPADRVVIEMRQAFCGLLKHVAEVVCQPALLTAFRCNEQSLLLLHHNTTCQSKALASRYPMALL